MNRPRRAAATTRRPIAKGTRITDPVLRRTQLNYSLRGEKLTEIRAFATPRQETYATYVYSANGNQLSITDSRSNQTTFAYDGFNRLLRTCQPGTSSCTTTPTGSPALYEELSYDAQGNIRTRRNRAGETITYAPDNLDRTKTRVLPLSGGGSLTTTLGYDLAGRVLNLSDTSGQSLVNGYDSARRLTSIQHTIPGLSGSQTLSYQYDLASNRTRLTWPDAYTIQYVYDALNRLSTATENGTTLLATYGYDPRSRRTSLLYGNGASVAYSYSIASDLQTLTHDLSGTSTDQSLSFGYTPAHQLATTTASNAAYLWAPAGATTNTYAAANALNQYPTVNGTAYGYDTKGNLTTDGIWTYGYDAENKLLTANKTGTAASYAYDPLGHRTTKTVNGTASYFLGDSQDDEIAEYSASGTLTNRYIPGPGIDEPIAQVTAAGARSYFHEDKQGSVMAMSGTAAARTEGPYTYDAYGVGAPTTGEPFKYTGRRLDPETGLYYYRARYYSSKDGRFLQTDPIGSKDDLNLYAYVKNDPLNATDPSGQCGLPCAVAFAAGVGGVVSAGIEAYKEFRAGEGFSRGKIVGEGVKGALVGAAIALGGAGAGALASGGAGITAGEIRAITAVGSGLGGATEHLAVAPSVDSIVSSLTGSNDEAKSDVQYSQEAAAIFVGAGAGEMVKAGLGSLSGTTGIAARDAFTEAAATVAGTTAENKANSVMSPTQPKPTCSRSDNKNGGC